MTDRAQAITRLNAVACRPCQKGFHANCERSVRKHWSSREEIECQCKTTEHEIFKDTCSYMRTESATGDEYRCGAPARETMELSERFGWLDGEPNIGSANVELCGRHAGTIKRLRTIEERERLERQRAARLREQQRNEQEQIQAHYEETAATLKAAYGVPVHYERYQGRHKVHYVEIEADALLALVEAAAEKLEEATGSFWPFVPDNGVTAEDFVPKSSTPSSLD